MLSLHLHYFKSKMPNSNFLIFLSLSIFSLSHGDLVPVQEPFKKFEYKYSFKGPYLAQPDGSIPFFEKRGSALATDQNVRITLSLRNQKGAIWAKNKTNFENWEVNLVFRIGGRGKTGGEGLAFWFVDDKPSDGVTGKIFGGPDGPWKGLGLFWDSYDNDGKFNNPAITAIVNYGGITYDHATDGLNQALASCIKDFRNTHYPLKAEIRYYKNILTLSVNSGVSREGNLEVCFQQHNVQLPQSGYFGISAMTGALADDHDVFKFLSYSLHDSPPINPDNVRELEHQKLEKEFENLKEKFSKQKEEYQQQHPDEAKNHHKEHIDDIEEEFDDEYAKEFKDIFQEQDNTRSEVAGLMAKLETVLKKHEALAEALKGVNVSGIGTIGGVASTFQRFEVDNLLMANRDLAQLSKDIKEMLNNLNTEMLTKISEYIEPEDASNPLAQLIEANDGLNGVRKEVVDVSVRLGQQEERMRWREGMAKYREEHCTSVIVSNCFTTPGFILFSGISTILFLGALIYKDKRQKEREQNKQNFY